MSLAKLISMTIGAAGIFLSIDAIAQEKSLGEQEYRQNCISCHGVSGKGDGYLLGYFNTKAPDLTQLAIRNEGVFPFDHVYQVIDGRAYVEIHGPRDMPVWGNEYDESAKEFYRQKFGLDAEPFVRGRILSLVEYIYSLQTQ